MSKSIKTSIWCVFGGLGLLAAASPARAQPCSVQAGFTFNMQSHGCQCHLGPWYSYFPYDAYFQVPPPVCGQRSYPNWPTPFPPAQAAPAARQNQAPPNGMGQAPMYPGQWPTQMVGYQPAGHYGMQSAIDFR